ncbi:DNA cytosine methyltransferase [Herpetosiphon llansteffanensis]|uniref:DNA cytosine methyltransferase n=1 Tax=Herpetosiphon llansteffanensis TaxID=2094568 RepID=UPI000D7C49D6|nr:DNA cytosine methyltransferase [Herpetosiphon llansteffanensis]
MLKSISLFSGGGGLDCGLEAVGFESRFCTDIDFHSCETLKQMKNASLKGEKGGLKNAYILQKNIVDLSIEEIIQQSRLKVGEIDLLTGGPPCQSFSVFGRRQGLNDPRGQLVWEYLRILRGLRPKVFLFENVPGLLSIDNGLVFKNFLDAVQEPFNGYSYNVTKYVVDAAHYGVPQFRTRVLIIGVLNNSGLEFPSENIPFVTHDDPKSTKVAEKLLLPFNTVKDALVGLPTIEDNVLIKNHVGRKHGSDIKERYANLVFGERDPKTRINRLHPQRPSYTIIVGSDKGGGKGHVHPYLPREVTPRESARMQSFPDWWGFSGTSRHPIRQIGNAVPPILAAAIGSFICENIFKQKPLDRHTIWKKLGQEHLLTTEDSKA